MFPRILCAQNYYDFEDGEMSEWEQSPPNRWESSAELPLNGLYSLHHVFDNPEAGEDWVYVNLDYPQLDSSLSFSFQIRHSYHPSSGNNWQIGVLNSAPDQMLDGFVFGVNFTASDDLIRLWQVIVGETFVVVETEVNYEKQIGRSGSGFYPFQECFRMVVR